MFNLDKSRYINDPKLFKKITTDIWEIRTEVKKIQYRLFAFWDKRNSKSTLVICTHGIIKKSEKLPGKEIKKAEKIMKLYFENY